MQHQEDWIDEIMSSINGIQPASPSGAMLHIIQERIASTQAQVFVSVRKLAWAAVAAVLLIVINFFTLSLQTDNTGENSSNNPYQQTLLTDYTLYE